MANIKTITINGAAISAEKFNLLNECIPENCDPSLWESDILGGRTDFLTYQGKTITQQVQDEFPPKLTPFKNNFNQFLVHPLCPYIGQQVHFLPFPRFSGELALNESNVLTLSTTSYVLVSDNPEAILEKTTTIAKSDKNHTQLLTAKKSLLKQHNNIFCVQAVYTYDDKGIESIAISVPPTLAAELEPLRAAHSTLQSALKLLSSMSAVALKKSSHTERRKDLNSLIDEIEYHRESLDIMTRRTFTEREIVDIYNTIDQAITSTVEKVREHTPALAIVWHAIRWLFARLPGMDKDYSSERKLLRQQSIFKTSFSCAQELAVADNPHYPSGLTQA